jgi:hypothetical protein
MIKTKKKQEEEIKDVDTEIAELLSSYCLTPGCTPKIHLQEVKEIMQILRDRSLLKGGD